jgi:putative iron-dependent peroxidase
MAASSQSWVLAAPAPAGRFLVFDMRVDADPRPSLLRLRETFSPEHGVVGFGQPLVAALGKKVPGLRAFPGLAGPGCSFPSTQGGLWAFVQGTGGPSEVHDRSLTLRAALGDAFVLRDEVSTFKFRDGRDLTGYLDGTANPRGDLAAKAAIVAGAGTGLDGSTFVAIQRYRHDLEGFRKLARPAQDDVIGRRFADNEELPEAPASAHVKRTEQESFDPEAFVVRRSMPWGGVGEGGLYFVAYGESLDRFEKQLRRMAGLDDGIVDALLRYSVALTGGYYWCPPVMDGRLELGILGL